MRAQTFVRNPFQYYGDRVYRAWSSVVTVNIEVYNNLPTIITVANSLPIINIYVGTKYMSEMHQVAGLAVNDSGS